MPKYYCDYCDVFLAVDSPSVRKMHNSGWKHKTNVRAYYAQFAQDVNVPTADLKPIDMALPPTFPQNFVLPSNLRMPTGFVPNVPMMPQMIPPPGMGAPPPMIGSLPPMNLQQTPGVRPTYK
ncbi:U1 small nuclear ribonucleoprotein C [Acrasis kona]|uniref:U1 small nuclear ribonucleoprotein C n=1 Tax=Acrasis kona TaxID=1008807 RepID=A0AAW2ZMQ7_9EUKA